MNNNLLWYACYGSNMDLGRFLKYIQGGQLIVNGITKNYYGCSSDTTPPRDSEPYLIQKRFYFAKTSTTWNGHGVGFISKKSDKRSNTYAKLYLISKEQFNHLVAQENGGNTETINYNDLQTNKKFDIQRGFYNRIVQLDDNYKGSPILTFTNSQICQKNHPMDEYVRLISSGLKSTHNLSNENIAKYIQKAKK